MEENSVNEENQVEQEKPFVMGNLIELSGFKVLKRDEITILKKIIGNQLRKIIDKFGEVERLKFHLKTIHENDLNHRTYELHGSLIKGKSYNVEAENKNIFICVDVIMKKLYNLVDN